MEDYLRCPVSILRCFLLLLMLKVSGAQEPTVTLRQGKIIGIKVYPDSSPYPINMYLGIPYAEPPIGKLRFASPVRHRGWNRTLYAHRQAPRCLQPQTKTQRANREQSEDCLYLNIWTPQQTRSSSDPEGLPVLLFIHGESWSIDTPIDVPGQDIAAEGVIFITIAFRLNVFGFFNLASTLGRGNLGILDQYMALVWVKENIHHFGGDPDMITLAGHSIGANSVLYQLLSPRTSGLFQRSIILSPRDLWSTIARSADDTQPDWFAPVTFTRTLLTSLGCDGPDMQLIRCARLMKSEDILRTFQLIDGNSTLSGTLTPSSDSFLHETSRFIPYRLTKLLSSSERVKNMPTLFGMTDMDAVDNNEELWVELTSEGAIAIEQYTITTIIPKLLKQHSLYESKRRTELVEAIRWEYFDSLGITKTDPWLWTEAVIRLESTALSETAASLLSQQLLNILSPLYLYRYTQPGGVDLYGKELNHTGAARGTDLPLMLGPTLLQQLVRRRLLPAEERLSRILRILITDFVKFGAPPVHGPGEGWRQYTERDPYVQTLSYSYIGGASWRNSHFWLNYLTKVNNITVISDATDIIMELRANQGGAGGLKGAVYALAGLTCLLAILLGASGLVLRTLTQHRDNNTTSFNS